jgi:hypothetical protein
MKYIKFLLLTFICINSYSQIGINTVNPAQSSLLEINSTSKGVLFPELTTTQRDAIVSPAIGLTIYNSTLNTLEFFTGTGWMNVTNKPANISNVVATSSQALVYFTPSSANSVINYTVTSSPGGITATGTTSPITVTGLQNNINYTFTITTNYSVGSSFTTPTSTITSTPLNIPGSISSLTTKPGNGQVELNWITPSGVISQYDIQYKRVSDVNWSSVSSFTNSVIITNLINNESYQFRVAATNNGGTASYSPISISSPILNNLLVYDNFDTNLINPSIWSEYESGYTNSPQSGPIQVSNGRLWINGTSTQMNANYLKSLISLSRTSANLVIQMDVIFPSCSVVNSNQFLRYGPVIDNANSTMYFINRNSANTYCISNSLCSTANPCSDNLPVNFKVVYKTTGGADVYINGVLSTGLNSSVAQNPASFTNFPFSIGQYSSSQLFIDNIAISGLPSAPNSPKSVTAIASNMSAAVYFDGTDTGGLQPVTYTVTATPGNQTVQGTSSPIFFNGLQNGTSYTFTVNATNSVGTSANSLPSNPVIPIINLEAPIFYPQNEQIFINWKSIYANDYQIEYKASNSSTWIIENDGINNNTSYTISGLTNGITYDIRIKPIVNGVSYDYSPVIQAIPTNTYNGNIWHQIVSTGQSLSVGGSGSPLLTTTQPFQNKMLNSTSTDLIPLVENSPFGSTGQESMSSSLANSLTNLSGGSNFNSIVTINGVGNTAYYGLKKGSGPFSNSLNRVISAKRIINSTTNIPFLVTALTIIHGENDHYSTQIPEVYKQYLIDWRNDYENDLYAITGQKGILPMFTDQVSSWTRYGTTVPTMALAQLDAAIENPNKIFMVCPKYFLDYVDGVHLFNYSYRRLGEYYAKAIKKVVVDKEPWVPLSPSTISRTANIITVNFNVPVAPLQFNTTAVLLKSNYGFEYFNANSSITITNVSLGSNGTSVEITLSATPSSPGKVAYAYTGVLNSNAGRFVTGAPRGNLCDSDATPAYYQDSNVPADMGNTLRNWCVTFIKDVN